MNKDMIKVLAIFLIIVPVGFILLKSINLEDSSGNAFESLTWAVVDSRLTIDPNEITFNSGTADLTVYMNGYDVINKKAYILEGDEWMPFDFVQDTINDSEWIPSYASATLTISKEKYPKGTYAVIAYACNIVDETYSCNDDKWVLNAFDIKEETDSISNAENQDIPDSTQSQEDQTVFDETGENAAVETNEPSQSETSPETIDTQTDEAVSQTENSEEANEDNAAEETAAAETITVEASINNSVTVAGEPIPIGP